MVEVIYRITISIYTDENQRRGVDIYAHPLWPFTMDSDGDPSDEYTVLFIYQKGDNEIRPAVYKRAHSLQRGLHSTPPSHLNHVYEQIFHAPPNAESFTGTYIASIKRCKNLKEL